MARASKRCSLSTWLMVFGTAALGCAGQALNDAANSQAQPKNAVASIPQRSSVADFIAPYRKPRVAALPLPDASRARMLIRNNAIYLSLYDALALAIENNLDVEVGRYQLSIAGTDTLRAKGGGTLRGLDYSVAESPVGVGGPGSPLLNSAAATVTPVTPTVNDLTALNQLTQTQTNLSVQSAAPFSQGPPIPVFDPSLVGQSSWFRRSDTTSLTTSTLGAGASNTVSPTLPNSLNFTTANLSYIEGFSPGTQIELALNNTAQVLYGNTSRYLPFTNPNASFTLTQPLLRGFGRSINLRYLKIAAINQKISRLVFYQQLISTVYGVARLYYDLVSLNENVEVKRETLRSARKLFDDDSSQVEQGTLAPLELTRARSLVSSSELDLIQSEGLVHQEEVILKTQLARRGSGDNFLAGLPIVPTDRIVIPADDDVPPLDTLVRDAVSSRPDLAQANLQAQTGEMAAQGSQNALRPELDVVGNIQTRGSSETPFTVLGSTGTGLITIPQDLASGGLRTSRIYQAGIQLNLPLRNRAAEADAARDLLQLRQSEARVQRLTNEVREDIESSTIALRTARKAYDASIESRRYQEQLLDAEKDKLGVGASTNFLVIQQQGYVAQARSTEVAARSVWIKARIALDRSLGNLLEKNGIQFDDAVVGNLPGTPVASPK